ncbi:hypothetical protein E4191_07630 [Paracoccus liaowanqingii]|uniref:Head-tail adaptor protein n=1 Tax=Paracoccus liaowanqingii TaxID=2560053 RepID=A0A4P7HKF8_9RHOB|nr:hypothetical protein [Paracoccus liaowanqingii]QBX34595.1 hypothetical protein E4191_07630 [Paracoccus liaowanqingii]
MTFDYTRLRATADRLIGRFGKPATLTRSTAPAGAPQYPWDEVTPSQPVTQSFTVTVVEDKATVRYSRADEGALIPRSVRVLTIATDGEAPRMGDRIILADRPHEIVLVSPLQPGATLLLHEAEISA